MKECAESPDPLARNQMIGLANVAMRLRDFCGDQSCFVVLSGDICNDVPMATVE
jgi:hypothetical protein